MTIKELKEKIANLPDDMPVVYSGGDHDYYHANNSVVTYAHDGNWTLVQYGGEDCEEDYGAKIKVFVVA